eukprot:1295092-Rhodomonas_salina.1
MTGLELWRAYRECSPRAPPDVESARVSPEPQIIIARCGAVRRPGPWRACTRRGASACAGCSSGGACAAPSRCRTVCRGTTAASTGRQSTLRIPSRKRCPKTRTLNNVTSYSAAPYRLLD